MAETITIPSPSLFLSSPNPSPTSSSPIKKPTIRSPLSAQRNAQKAAETTGVTKRKQSKSRNGCITCKAKRLKCDEKKPSCQQCAKRSVVCGGYKKDFKWRPFEETDFTSKASGKTKRGSPSSSTSFPPQMAIAHSSISAAFQEAYSIPPRPSAPSLHPSATYIESAYHHTNDLYHVQSLPQYAAGPPISPVNPFVPGSSSNSSSLFSAASTEMKHRQTRAASSVSSGQSPRLVDLLLPGTDLSIPPEEYMSFRSQHPESFYQPTGLTPPAENLDDDVEEIPRDSVAESEAWIMRLPSPTPSNSSSSSSESNGIALLLQPQLSSSSPEMLCRRFDRDTCGVLSIADGPTENPWRTLIWPLARDCPALYHAIASMTSFHQSKDSPGLRISGIDHMRTSVRALASGIENMHLDTAISTTLVLAFSESWDQHISTGINHIKGAKALIDKALVRHHQKPVKGDELARLKFLCNTWIYVDVLSRLTATDDDEFNDFDIVSDAVYMDNAANTRLDPLMGCASTLFPIIGRVANLVRKVRRTDSVSPSVISQALEYKKQLEDWQPPSYIEDPEDETTTTQDSMQTAAAYQYATLLYLHQAVPEIPSLSSLVLARRALCELATVEPQSRSVIVHIYPLMAAGCEATTEEDRTWVQSRWEMLASRMKLGIIERCLEVTKEVWNRRDAYEAQCGSDNIASTMSPSPVNSMKRGFDSVCDDSDADGLFCWLDSGNKRRVMSLFDTPQPAPVQQDRQEIRRRSEVSVQPLPLEYTVKGRLHWLGVMKDWSWEVLLG